MTADPRALHAWLDWFSAMGADEWIGEQAINRLAPPPEPPAPAGSPPAQAPDTATPGERQTLRPASDAVQDARALAAACTSVQELEAALGAFDGCSLKDTAINLCFADGDPGASLMLIGEAPGSEEDRQGRPFVGPSGRLLDRMLGAIGLERSAVYITNVIYWRPPGNRAPTQAEMAVCLPFLERQIELVRPRLIVFAGGIAARVLLGVSEGVTKLRGRRFSYQPSDGPAVPAMVMFHPAYLLRQPAHKRLAWRDLLTVQRLLAELKSDAGGNCRVNLD